MKRSEFFLLITCISIAGCSTNLLDQDVTVDAQSLKTHVQNIIDTPTPRNYLNVESLNQVADYIDSTFTLYSSDVEIQEFTVEGNVYKNVLCSFGNTDAKRIIVGAHYDVCGDQNGADDNASAVAGLLELAKLLHSYPTDSEYRIDLVAYSLEEPPFFATQSMGSAVHAQYIIDNDIRVKFMICLEMIGYYTDEKDSQKFPIGLLKWFYPNEGTFITVASNFKSNCLASKMKRLMSKISDIKVCKFVGPTFIRGIDFSDHRNYWAHGIKAVMITDTAFYRNPNYHETTDTIETLNFDKIAEVVKGVYATIMNL